ncbi:hypothetical protein [Pseudomonas graminis]|uniref:hypothetical protein n=1 Tax=Pseudomonas graminis TaxID=158627 RepID=UPI003C1CF8FB
MINEQAQDRLLEAVDRHIEQASQSNSEVEPRFQISLGEDPVSERMELYGWLMSELAKRHPFLRFNIREMGSGNTLVIDFEAA